MRVLSLFFWITVTAFGLPEIGKPAPALTVDHVIGGPSQINLSWEGLKGRSVVLEFWATWCTPCREQIPHLNALTRKYRERPLTFLALTDEDDIPLVNRFLKQYPIEGLVGIDRGSVTFERYGIVGRPTTVLIDASGVVRAVLTSRRLDENMLDLLLAGKAVPTDADTSAVADRPREHSPSDAIVQFSIRPAAPASASGYSPGFMEFKNKTFRGWGLDLKRLLSLAYGFPEDRIILADRLPKDRYDIVITVRTDKFEDTKHLLKPALEHAFHLSVTSNRRPTEVYVLTTSPSGTRNLRPSTTASSRIWRDGNVLTAVSATFGSLAQSLGSFVGKPVIDETGVEDRHDFSLDVGDGKAETVSRVLENHFGLNLQLATRPREFLVVQ